MRKYVKLIILVVIIVITFGFVINAYFYNLAEQESTNLILREQVRTKKIQQEYAKAIEEVFRLENKIRADTSKKYKKVSSEYFNAIIPAVKAIDLCKCPTDFQQKHVHYIQALENAIRLINKYENRKLIVAFSLLSGIVSGQESTFEKEHRQAMERLDNTSTDIKIISLKYGVQSGLD